MSGTESDDCFPVYVPKINVQQHIEEVQQSIVCAVCREAFYKPVVLLCQHTFCKACVEKLPRKKCPTCNLCFSVPKEHNRILHDIAKIYYNDTWLEKEAEECRENAKRSLRQKIESELRNELYNEVVNNNTAGSIPAHIQQVLDVLNDPATIKKFTYLFIKFAMVANAIACFIGLFIPFDITGGRIDKFMDTIPSSINCALFIVTGVQYCVFEFMSRTRQRPNQPNQQVLHVPFGAYMRTNAWPN